MLLVLQPRTPSGAYDILGWLSLGCIDTQQDGDVRGIVAKDLLGYNEGPTDCSVKLEVAIDGEAACIDMAAARSEKPRKPGWLGNRVRRGFDLPFQG